MFGVELTRLRVFLNSNSYFDGLVDQVLWLVLSKIVYLTNGLISTLRRVSLELWNRNVRKSVSLTLFEDFSPIYKVSLDFDLGLVNSATLANLIDWPSCNTFDVFKGHV